MSKTYNYYSGNLTYFLKFVKETRAVYYRFMSGDFEGLTTHQIAQILLQNDICVSQGLGLPKALVPKYVRERILNKFVSTADITNYHAVVVTFLNLTRSIIVPSEIFNISPIIQAYHGSLLPRLNFGFTKGILEFNLLNFNKLLQVVRIQKTNLEESLDERNQFTDKFEFPSFQDFLLSDEEKLKKEQFKRLKIDIVNYNTNLLETKVSFLEELEYDLECSISKIKDTRDCLLSLKFQEVEPGKLDLVGNKLIDSDVYFNFYLFLTENIETKFMSLSFKEYHLTNKSGPNGHASKCFDIDFLSILQHEEYYCELVNFEPRLKSLFQKVFKLFVLKNKILTKEIGSNIHYRKLIQFPDKEGKNRIIAINDYFLQTIFRPLHQVLFKLLKTIPNDYTFNQTGFLEVINNLPLDYNQKF